MERETAEVRSEARGSHWVAWVVAPGQPKPEGPVLMVGQTQQEAEARMRAWWAARRPA